MSKAMRVARWIAGLALGSLLVGALVWSAREAILERAGALLVSEDPLEPADMIVVSMPTMIEDLLEASRLYAKGLAPLIVFPATKEASYNEDLRQLGMHRLPPARYAAWFLEQTGVPRSAVQVLPTLSDGTETAIAAVGRYAREHQPKRIVYVVSRTHSTRSRWLLERQLPSATELVMRSPRTDDFDPGSWWHDRSASREVLMEYLRWINSFVLGDPWSHAHRPLERAGQPTKSGHT